MFHQFSAVEQSNTLCVCVCVCEHSPGTSLQVRDGLGMETRVSSPGEEGWGLERGLSLGSRSLSRWSEGVALRIRASGLDFWWFLELVSSCGSSFSRL